MLMEDIPPQLIINWDQTGLHYTPFSSWTMEKQGSKHVAIAGIDDKRQLAVLWLASSTTSSHLQGDDHALFTISYKLPDDWDVCFTPNHWANEDTSLSYISIIVVPFFECKREELGLSSRYPALALFDHFKGQTTEKVFKLLEKHS